MAELTEEDIVAAVKKALADHPCRFDVRPKDIDHLVGMVVDIGAAVTGEADGSFRAGVEQLRRGHLWLIERLKHDDEYTENHKAMTGARSVALSFGMKLAHLCLWCFVGLVALGLVLFGLTKVGTVKVGG